MSFSLFHNITCYWCREVSEYLNTQWFFCSFQSKVNANSASLLWETYNNYYFFFTKIKSILGVPRHSRTFSRNLYLRSYTISYLNAFCYKLFLCWCSIRFFLQIYIIKFCHYSWRTRPILKVQYHQSSFTALHQIFFFEVHTNLCS